MNSSRVFETLLRGIAANAASATSNNSTEYINILNNYVRGQQTYHQNIERILEFIDLPMLNIDLTPMINRDASGTYVDISANTTAYPYATLNGEPATCPITLEQFQDGETVRRINGCGHVFRDAALRRWFQRNNNCPVCRRGL